MSQPDEAALVAEHVNRYPSGASEPDEEAVLRSLYGEADGDGIYRGSGDEGEAQ